MRRDDVAGYAGLPQRSVFIVDRDGVIRWTWVRRPEQPLPDFDQVVDEARRVAASLAGPNAG